MSHALRCSSFENAVPSCNRLMNTSCAMSSASCGELAWLSAMRYTSAPHVAIACSMNASDRGLVSMRATSLPLICTRKGKRSRTRPLFWETWRCGNACGWRWLGCGLACRVFGEFGEGVVGWVVEVGGVDEVGLRLGGAVGEGGCETEDGAAQLLCGSLLDGGVQ